MLKYFSQVYRAVMPKSLPVLHGLLDRRLERDAIQSNTAATADSKVCARLANLSKNGRQYEKKEIRKKEEAFHLISSIFIVGCVVDELYKAVGEAHAGRQRSKRNQFW